MIRFVAITTAAVALTGCATTATWQHPARMGDGHDGATMALAECQAYASGTGSAPAPTARMDVPAPTSYTTRGTYTDYGSHGTFSGTTRANGSFASGFASGYNSGAAIGDAIASIQYQKRIGEVTAACMRTQGWVDTSTPEGKTKFQSIVAASASNDAKTGAARSESIRKNIETAIEHTFDFEAAQKNGIQYRSDRQKREAFFDYVASMLDDPRYADWKAIAVTMWANARIREKFGISD